MNSNRKVNLLYKAGLLAFLAGMGLRHWGHGEVHDFGEGVFVGAAIILMLIGIWRSRREAYEGD
jgi:hypothetical protein